MKERMKRPETRKRCIPSMSSGGCYSRRTTRTRRGLGRRPGACGRALEDEAKAARRAEREEAEASRWRTREKRQQEDRAGERSSSACKRARQESVHLLSTPSGFRPMPVAPGN